MLHLLTKMDGIGGRIRKARRELKLGQVKLAKILGCTHGYISQIETERRKPSLETVFALIELYNVNANWLLTGKGEMFLSESKGKGSFVSSISQWLETEEGKKELMENFEILPEEKQEMYYHKIKGDAIEEKLRRK